MSSRSRPALLTTIVVLTLVATSAPARAQAERYGESWRWVRFGTEDGLPDARVTDVCEIEGEVLAATASGLASYDGWTWSAVGPESGLSAGPLHSISVDRAGRPWVLGLAGLFFREGGRFRPVALQDEFRIPPRSAVAHLPDGDVLVLGTRRDDAFATILRLDAGGVLHSAEPGGAGSEAAAKIIQGRRRVWAQMRGGLHRLEGERWVRVQASSDGPEVLRVLAENRAGQVVAGWVDPSRMLGIWEWSGEDEPRRNPDEGRGGLVAADVHATGEAIAVYESNEVRLRVGDTWRALRPVNEALLSARFVRYRPDGDLWVGTDRGLYLCRLSSRRWTSWRHDQPNSLANRVQEILLASDGDVWQATMAGLEHRRQDGALVHVPPLPGMPEVQVTGVAEDDRGRVWACSGSSFTGVFVLDTNGWSRRERDAHGNPLGLIHKIRRDHSGRLWLLQLSRSLEDLHALEGDVLRVEGDEILRWEPARELRPGRFYDLAEDADGSLWLAHSGGIGRWREGSGWRIWGSDEGLEALRVLRVAPDGAGGAWLALDEGGLGRVDPDGSFRVERVGSAPEDLQVFDLALDGDERLWLSTFEGLYALHRGHWSAFEVVSGLGTPRLWPVLPDGERLLAGTDGSGTFVLDLAERDTPPPRVRLGEPTVESGRALLRWRTQAHWGELPQDGIETRYRLDDGPWSDWSLEREVELVGLPAREHRLQVQAKGLFGGFDEEGAALAFRVPRRLLQSPGFLVPLGTLSAALIVLGIVSGARRRRDARALRRSEREHRQLMEQASDAIFLCDERGFCRQANGRALALTGRARDDLVGRHVAEFLVEAREGSGSGLEARLRRSASELHELEALAADGAHTPVEAAAACLDDGRLQIIARDVTERRRLEQERRALERRLTERQKLESLGLLAGGVAHDFNNLLMVVHGNAERALDDVAEGTRARRSLRRVLQSARRARELTAQLLSFAGKDELRAEALDVDRLVREIGEMLRSSLPGNLMLTYRLDADKEQVRADAGRLQQVVLNLIVNAADAVGGSPGEVVVRTDTLRPGDPTFARAGWEDVPADRSWVRVEVSDDGCGMDAGVRSRIFDPFFTTKSTGRGLGLAAVQGILRMHGGLIRVESEVWRGSTFTVLLPPAGPTSERETGAPEPVSDRVGLGTAHVGSARDVPLVLVVDDDADVREASAGLLDLVGLRSAVADGGRHGIDLFRRDPRRYSAVLLDLTMPDLSGLETLESLRALRPDVPVLLVSGYSEESAHLEHELDGRTGFLRKPFTGRELRGALEALLVSQRTL